MNRRLAFGPALATASAFIGMSMFPSQAAAEDVRCAPIYDIVEPDRASPLLQETIGYYATQDIDVHVTILNKAPQGVDDAKEIANYQTQTAQECGYADNNYISVIITTSPRLYNTQLANKANADITKSTVDRFNSKFENNLRDTKTPFKDDIAGLLQDIDPYKPKPDPVKIEIPEIPVVPVLATLGGIVVAGAAGARLWRHKVILSKFTFGNTQLLEEYEKISTTVYDVEETVKLLPESDAPELRDAQEKLVAELDDFDEQISAARSGYRKESRRLWPSVENASEVSRELIGISSKIRSLRMPAQAQLETYKKIQENLDYNAQDYDKLLNEAQDICYRLSAKGWNIPELEKAISGSRDIRNRVQGLIESGYVEQPGTLIEKSKPDLTEIKNILLSLASRREQADIDINNQSDALDETSKIIANVQADFSALRQKYDHSCYEDLEESVSSLDEKLISLGSTTTEAQTTAGKKAYADLLISEKMIEDFKDTQDSIASISSIVSDRSKQLIKIEQDLPGRLSDIDKSLEGVYHYTFNVHSTDVEDETRDEIERTIKEFSEFKETDVAEHKPKYLFLNKTSQAYAGKVRELAQRANSEKAEMDRLRAEFKRKISDAGRSLADYESYINRNRSALRSRHPDPTIIPEYQSGYSRGELRDGITQIGILISTIQTNHNEAQREISIAQQHSNSGGNWGDNSSSSMSNFGGSWGGGTSNSGGGW